MQKKSLLLLVIAVSMLFTYFSTSDAYTPGRLPTNGNLKKWDITKTQYPNIDNNGNIILEFNRVGCADFRDFNGLISEFQAYLNSMNQWNKFEFCNAKLVYGGKTEAKKDGNDNKNTLYFDNKGNISPGVFGLATVTYNANTGEILDADIGLNDTSFAWDTLGRNTSGISNKAYVEPIMTHEIGHLFGLDHTFLRLSSMSPSAYVGEISQHFLKRDDEIGVSVLYPDANFGSAFATLGGIATKNSIPTFGASFSIVSLKDFMPVISGLSESSGVFALAGIEPGRYWLITFPVDIQNLGSYYDTIDTDIAPQIIGINVGTASNPAINQEPDEFLLKEGSVNPVNPALTTKGTVVPFEPNDNSTDATALMLDSANGSPIALVADIEDNSDVDYYKFNIQSGKKYSFIVISSCFTTGFDSRLTLYDSTMNEIISPNAASAAYMVEADDADPEAYDVDGEILDPRVEGWTSTYSGEAHLKITGWAGQSGYYFLIVREHDVIDVPDIAASEISINKTSLTVNSAETARVIVIARNKYNDKITNLSANAVDIKIGASTITATQDSVDKAKFYIDVNAPAATGSDEITAIITPNVEPILQKVTIFYVDSVSAGDSEITAMPESSFADGYSEVLVTLNPRDSNGINAYDSTLTVTGDTSHGTLRAFNFDIDTGFYTAILTAPLSSLKINANVDVFINTDKVGTVNVVFEGRIRSTSSSGGGGGCSSSNVSDGSQNVSLIGLLLFVLGLFIVRITRKH
ncbi:MAG: matrixin family metalloprotease [Planctomycetes bacterium]|nr:matrixin family metalloprotease [Planctomycetota bacterium]